MRYLLLSLVVLAPWFGAPNLSAQTTPFPKPYDDPETGPPRMAAQQAADTMEVPPGFQVELFASEPMVRQPIGMTIDSQGRFWVAENYTYARSGINFDLSLRDRIVVLEDEDGDGKADKRTVFWDQAERLTSVEVGFGGVWALCAPHLIFIPDADGDLVPDGPPQVMLEGWQADSVRHNFVNGLRWGPDGWLYGRHGVQAVSMVAAPGAPEEDRVRMDCGIWRFHPTRRLFDVVCRGTTNPWGMDWDRHGELFFINTVIGHLWHGVPGAYFQRMHGEHANPHLYELISQTADHVHWDETHEGWTAQKKGLSAGSDAAGGGHAHSGMLIYQDSQWPESYRDSLFTLNFHGRRINRDSLHREGATYVGRHQADFAKSQDAWFRGIDLLSGPTGEVYVLDWSDTGECHENDGVHRSSGRIFTIKHENHTANDRPTRMPQDDQAALANWSLADAVWQSRQARHQLHQQAALGHALEPAVAILRSALQADDPLRVLRAMWTLRVIDALEPAELLELSRHADEHVRVWSLRMLADASMVSDAAQQRIAEMAAEDQSGLVLTYAASALPKLDDAARWQVAAALASQARFAEDRVLPNLVWYGIEPLVANNPSAAVACLQSSAMPKLKRFIAQRLAFSLDTNPAAIDGVVQVIARSNDVDEQWLLLSGVAAALTGWSTAPEPAGWSELAERLQDHHQASLRGLVGELSLVFGSGRGAESLLAIVGDGAQPTVSRIRAVEALAAANAAGLTEQLERLLRDRRMSAAAVRGLALAAPDSYPQTVVQEYHRLPIDGRQAAIESLIQRPAWAAMLLQATEENAISKEDVSASALRQIQLLGDSELNARVLRLWPERRLIQADRVKQTHALKEALTAARLAAADLSAGKALFAKTCGSCHKLFGEGGEIGPGLTGAQRGNVTYWLENILAPSAAVPANYRVSVVLLDDGRVINGVIVGQTSQTLRVQTATKLETIPQHRVETIRATELSLMPDGLLDDWSSGEVRDLMAYLMAP